MPSTHQLLSPRLRALGLLGLAGLFGNVACQPTSSPPGDEPLEIVSVGVDPTAVITPDNDPRAKRQMSTELQGLLPTDFPEQFPIYLPASITDLAAGDVGKRSVELTFAIGEDSLTTWLGRQLPAKGWRHEGNDRWVREGTAVEATVATDSIGTTLTVRY